MLQTTMLLELLKDFNNPDLKHVDVCNRIYNEFPQAEDFLLQLYNERLN